MINLKYSGPFIFFIGVITIVIFILFFATKLISIWIIYGVLSFSLILPYIGLAVSLALFNWGLLIVSAILFSISYYLGIENYSKVWFYFTSTPDASKHLYLSIPIISFCAAFMLFMPKNINKYLLLPICTIAGFMLAITIKLNEPTLHNPIITKLAFFIVIWLMLSVILTVRFFYRNWFSIPIKIFASWLLASAFLYGGTFLVVKFNLITLKTKNDESVKIKPIENENLLIPDFTQTN